LRAAALLIVALLVLPAPAAAQATAFDPDLAFPTQTERRIADVASWATVAAAIALDSQASWDAPDRRRALLLEGTRLGVTFAASQLTKTLIGRTRPCARLPEGCGRDAITASFYSMHSAYAGQAIGGARIALTFPLLVSTAELRAAAGKHELTDVLVGGLVGWLTGRFIR
jgi:hypothetical protein